MKRTLIPAGIALVIILSILATLPAKRDPRAPKFVPGEPSGLKPFAVLHYDWSELVPFADDKVWIWGLSGTNPRCFFYDLRARKTVGELLNGGPVFCTQDQTKLLCGGRGSLATSARQKVVEF